MQYLYSIQYFFLGQLAKALLCLQHFASIVSSQPGPHKRPHIIGVAAPNNFSPFLRPLPLHHLTIPTLTASPPPPV